MMPLPASDSPILLDHARYKVRYKALSCTNDAFGRCVTCLLLLALQLVLMSQLVADQGPLPILSRTKYSSPEARYLLTVSPNDKHGRGSARYTLSRNGDEVWSSEFPFTIWNGGVTDDGFVVGYAYSHGPSGIPDQRFGRGSGNLNVVIVAHTGELLLNCAVARRESRFPHTAPNPHVRGLLIDSEFDRLIVRINDSDVNRGTECWWVFRISTGEIIAAFAPRALLPDAETARFVITAKRVLGSPLVLVHWWEHDGEQSGARFTLIDSAGSLIWALKKKDDYSIPSDQDAEDRLRDSIRTRDDFVTVRGTMTFDVLLLRTNTRISYSILKDESGKWIVRTRKGG
jgi:hypothetical protein